MLVSNIDEIRLKLQLQEKDLQKQTNDFLNSVYDKAGDKNITRTDSLSFDNIKGITLEEIDELFRDEEQNKLAKNLRLATLFSEDKNLSLAMFNTVLGQPFNLGSSFLFNSYEDKHSFLSSSKNSLAEVLHKSVSTRVYNEKLEAHEVIPQQRLDEILLEINSFSFLDALSSTSKDLYDRYEDEEDYSFLYNNMHLKYLELQEKYKKFDEISKNIIKQY